MLRFLEQLDRLKFDIFAIIFIALFLYFMPVEWLNPETAKVGGLLSMLIGKFILVSCGIIHAHVTREFLFPYISFSKEKEWSNNAMIIALYVIIIFGWTRGG
jgi:ABC-type nickel/cobalt efflux system permease component RcnA